MYRIFSLILSLILFCGCPAIAQQTKVLTAEKFNEYGLVYSLPVTALQITVTAERKTFIAGKYYKYAKKYLGTDDVIKEDSDSWTITDVNVERYGVASSDTQYLMQLKPGATTFIGVAPDGMLLSINTPPVAPPEFVNTSSTTSDTPRRGDEYLQYVDEDFLASQSSAKQAEMLMASLLEVRETILGITRGTADNMPSDGQQMELMLDALRKQERALTEAFTGVTFTNRAVRTFSYIPDEEGRNTLFRLSDFAGFVEADDYSGEPIYISTEIVREGTLPVDVNGEFKKFPKDGIAYCIPGTAAITISFRGKKLWNQEMDFAQYGNVFGLSPTLFTDKKNPSFAVFDPVTGGLREIGQVSL